MRPLPAVLLDLHEDFATGKLVLRRGRVSKSVDLVNGNPVSTSSTPRDETLGHFLVNSGVITEDQHRLAVTRASAVGGKLGEALVALQIMTVEQLIDQLGRQARHKLVQALRWPQGAWRFEEGHQPVEGMQLRMVEVVLDGLRETAVEDLARLARFDAMSFELTERGNRLRHELRRTFGERVVLALTPGASIADIERALGDRAQARLAIDAMVMCDAVVATAANIGLGASGPAVGRAATGDQPHDTLYDILFEDSYSGDRSTSGAAPLDFGPTEPVYAIHDEDSGIVSPAELAAVSTQRDQNAAATQAIAAEHTRIREADHYALLMVGSKASAAEIDDAHDLRSHLMNAAERGLGDSPREREKLVDIRAAYDLARATLLDVHQRAQYDRELAGGELVQAPPSIDTELNFRLAEGLMAKEQWAQAIGLIKTVLARSPGEADYHAALGWCEWNAGGASTPAAEAARPHLDRALAIDPDHAAGHDYMGRIDAALRVDDAEAMFHLERALERDPARVQAASALEALLVSRGELRRWERTLKRLLFRLRGRGDIAEATAWTRLAKLYLDHLDNRIAGLAALANAQRLAPRDPDVAALGERTARPETREPARAGWREALGDPTSGAALVRTTEAAGHGDAAFLAASTMVALGSADTSMETMYETHRVRGAAQPKGPLGRDHWSLLRHGDDSLDLGALLELVAPAVHTLAPMTLAAAELDASQHVGDSDLPPAFAKLRASIAVLLGVSPAPVYSRVELGSQIHVVACDPPVMIAGDEALTAPERPELVFRLARALTFVLPGRAVGASRPGRVLRAIVLAIAREAAGTDAGADDPLAAAASDAIARLTETTRAQARAAALRVLSRSGGGLNLSTWARSLSRTADRAGMLLAADIPAAFGGAREVGDLDKDLVEFAYSAAHVALRGALGLSSV